MPVRVAVPACSLRPSPHQADLGDAWPSCALERARPAARPPELVAKFGLAWNRGSPATRRPRPPRVRAPLSRQFATMPLQMPEECSPLHIDLKTGLRSCPTPRLARSSRVRSSSASWSVTSSDSRSPARSIRPSIRRPEFQPLSIASRSARFPPVDARAVTGDGAASHLRTDGHSKSATHLPRGGLSPSWTD